MIEGYVINNVGRGKHIYKRSFTPGMKISLEELYDMYKNKYRGSFDTGFLDWLEKNKVPHGFDIVVETIESEDMVMGGTEEGISEKERIFSAGEKKKQEEFKRPPIERTVHPGDMTSRQIADLKTKDKPKAVLQRIMSVHKLRRAKTMCKGRAGKETLLKLISERIVELS